MKKRIVSTIGLWAAIILVLALFGLPGGVFLLIALMIPALLELYALLDRMGYQCLRWFGCAFGTLILLATYFSSGLGEQPGTLVLTLSIIVLLIMMLAGLNLKKTLLPTLFGLVLIPFLLQFYVLVGLNFANPTEGLVMVIWLIAVAKFSDVGGLLVGSKFGRNRLAPLISPKKTWEGALGGVVFSVLIGVILKTLLWRWIPSSFTLLHAVLLAVPIGIFAIISDLVESYLKRLAEVKDSGSVIPGIGGAFDLMDSLLLTAPLGFILIRAFVS